MLPPFSARCQGTVALLLPSSCLFPFPLFSPSSPPPPSEQNAFQPPPGFSLCSLSLITPFPSSSSLLFILLPHCFVFSPQTHFFRLSPSSPLHRSLPLSFVPSILITSCVLPFSLILLQQEAWTSKVTAVSWVCWPILLRVLNHASYVTHAFANSLKFSHMWTDTFYMLVFEGVRPTSAYQHPCLLKHVHFQSHSICVS